MTSVSGRSEYSLNQKLWIPVSRASSIHWVSAENCVDFDLMHYDRLFTVPDLNEMKEGETYDDYLNRDSVKKLAGAKAEASLKDARPGDKFQFVRMGYYVADTKNPGTFNRIVSLKDGYKVK